MCACPRTEERQHTGSPAVLRPARVRIRARVRGCAHARCVCARSCTPAFRGSATLWLRPRSVISLTDDPRIRDPTYGRSYQKQIPRLTVVLRVIICSASAARPPLPQHCRRFVRPCGMACVMCARVVWHALCAPVAAGAPRRAHRPQGQGRQYSSTRGHTGHAQPLGIARQPAGTHRIPIVLSSAPYRR
jgi:hypothetical protein